MKHLQHSHNLKLIFMRDSRLVILKFATALLDFDFSLSSRGWHNWILSYLLGWALEKVDGQGYEAVISFKVAIDRELKSMACKAN